MTETKRSAKPRITLIATDHKRLSQLACAASHTMPDVASELMDELDRAQVLAKGRHAVDTVCMDCEVVYRNDTTGCVQTVTLVDPNEADIAKGRASVLTPIVAALIGLAVGKSVDWMTRTGEMKRLTVLEVREPRPAEVAELRARCPNSPRRPHLLLPRGRTIARLLLGTSRRGT